MSAIIGCVILPVEAFAAGLGGGAIVAFLTKHYYRLSMLLTALACLLWSTSLFRLAPTGLAMDDMGYIHTLPATFWVGIALLTVASALLWRAPREHKALLAIQLCLFITMIWLTPIALGRTVTGTRYSFALYNCTQRILIHGHLDPSSEWYHNWPALNIIETSWMTIGGISNPDYSIILASIPTQFAVALLLSIFMRRVLGLGNHWAMAVWFFILFNWTAQTYYSPQAFGIILLVTLFFLLSIGLAEKDISLSIRLLGILVILGLILTHLLTSITALFVVLVFETRRMVKKQGFLTLTLFLAALIVGWQVFFAGVFFTKTLPTFVTQVMDFELMWFRNVSRAQTGSEGHMAVVDVKMWMTVAAGVIALGGLALSRRFRAPGDRPTLLIGIGVFLMLPFQFYENEFLSRLFIYALPVLAYFAAKLLRTRATALLLSLALLVTLPFGIIGLHGNAMTDDLTTSQLAYWQSLNTNTSRGNLALGGMVATWSFGRPNYEYLREFSTIFTYGSRWPERMQARGWVIPNVPNYLGLTGYEDGGFKTWTDFTQGIHNLVIQADTMDDLTRFYENGEVTAYYQNGVLLPYYPPLESPSPLPAGG